MRRVLGVDPGLASTGYGIVEENGNKLSLLDSGVIRTDSGLSNDKRLLKIYDAIVGIIQSNRITGAGIEALYQSKNITSAIPVAQARGVVLLALAQQGIESAEYTPQAIKLAVVGAGSASKNQVQQMVRIILKLRDLPGSDHAADALGAAIAHLHATQVMISGRTRSPSDGRSSSDSRSSSDTRSHSASRSEMAQDREQ